MLENGTTTQTTYYAQADTSALGINPQDGMFYPHLYTQALAAQAVGGQAAASFQQPSQLWTPAMLHQRQPPGPQGSDVGWVPVFFLLQGIHPLPFTGIPDNATRITTITPSCASASVLVCHCPTT